MCEVVNCGGLCPQSNGSQTFWSQVSLGLLKTSKIPKKIVVVVLKQVVAIDICCNRN
jgi:hypothetical protein